MQYYRAEKRIVFSNKRVTYLLIPKNINIVRILTFICFFKRTKQIFQFTNQTFVPLQKTNTAQFTLYSLFTVFVVMTD